MINIPPFLDRQYKVYSENVKSRNKLHYLMGLYIRWKQYFKYERAVRTYKSSYPSLLSAYW